MGDERLEEAGRPELDEGGSASTIVPVVGIGASAGGLEVFQRLLGQLPVDTGLAIIFVQHLDPNHHSMLAGILARSTAMPVSEAVDDLAVEADHVYVIPPNADLTIASGALHLSPRKQPPGSHMPIDQLLRSLADQCGSRAIGVILSGTGSDGAAGVQAIRAAGGVTFAQDAATAKAAAMPQAAVATGCVDFVLPPDGIAAELMRIGRHPYVADARRAAQEPTSADDEKRFDAILAVLRGATGIDFALYRARMIRRRILRRLALRNIGSLAEYAERLQKDPDERAALQRDLLIGVTRFFRDPESFEALKKIVFPRILNGRPDNETIRVWVTGCATGEEAFSVAIALQEHMHETGVQFPVQIFASDINLTAIERARTGRYFENIAADLTPERLARCFTKVEGGYQVNKNLREMCVFARHNLLDDPPFSKLDLVTCRNVLIYLGGVQRSILPLFHYALKRTGFLMLGAAEAPPPTELFSAVDREHRIYSRQETAKKPHVFPAADRDARFRAAANGGAAARSDTDGSDVRREVDRVLLSKYSLAAVLVDDELEVVEIRGVAAPYLALPAGRVSFSLIKLIPDTGLFLEVEKLIHKARTSGEPSRQEDVPYGHDGHAGSLTVEVVPLRSGQGRANLVLFEPAPTAAGPAPNGGPAAARPEDDGPGRQIALLKEQLGAAKERFLAAVEEHQESRRESESTTEEALSANEELQSLNEELETAKEELQSTNQELVTVNDELQATNLALTEARDFAMSIVETVRQPLLVLDVDSRITLANRSFCRTFQVSALEVEGQVIYSLSRGNWDLPLLRDALDSLRHGARSFRDFEVDIDLPGLGRRSLLVGGSCINQLQTVLLAVDDVTVQRQAQQALRRSEDHLRQAQKMEAVGRLAGGIAHDFNNLLTAIIGYSSLLHDRLAGNEGALQQVEQIWNAGARAAALTQQLLAFSRHQVLQPKVLDLNAVVADFDKMLRRLVGEVIKFAVSYEPALWPVRVDPGEIGRAIMNLCLNARDAMPEGGTLTIETANVTLTEADGSDHGLAAGRYVAMAVRDTGIGMSAELRARIFEPFFTTKVMGQGTGLGLSTVQGIVGQSGGAIRCESEAGRGTTFTILLPAFAETLVTGARPPRGLAGAPTGTEVVLLVEDEDMVRMLARRVLERSGYVVHEARNGREGLAFCRAYEGSIHLLLTDVVMPEVGGRELAEAAVKVRPDMKVLFMSGHTEDVVLKEGVDSGAAFLQKPFAPVDLALKVREVLDAH